MKEVLCSLYQIDSERGSILTFTRRAHFPLLIRTCTCSTHIIVKETSYLYKWLIHVEELHIKTQEQSGSTNSWVVTADEGWGGCGRGCQSLDAFISYSDVSNSLSTWVKPHLMLQFPISCFNSLSSFHLSDWTVQMQSVNHTVMDSYSHWLSI